jgi:hypothetical protein
LSSIVGENAPGLVCPASGPAVGRNLYSSSVDQSTGGEDFSLHRVFEKRTFMRSFGRVGRLPSASKPRRRVPMQTDQCPWQELIVSGEAPKARERGRRLYTWSHGCNHYVLRLLRACSTASDSMRCALPTAARPLSLARHSARHASDRHVLNRREPPVPHTRALPQ